MNIETQNWHSGIILWFNLGKGLGIIRPSNPDADDIYFNISSIGDQSVESVWSGKHVEYHAEQNLIGMYATVLVSKSPNDE
ncbi:MAG: cold shock domain-containing protein [Planctomycetes bacterium]|nr:cold shock domain-containing protein [Planctomycetota bacterium]